MTSQIIIALGTGYAYGIVSITPISIPSPVRGLFLDANGAASITDLPQGCVYYFLACKSDGSGALSDAVAPTGQPQDITGFLQTNTVGTGTVTHTGALTAGRVILGNGTADVTAAGASFVAMQRASVTVTSAQLKALPTIVPIIAATGLLTAIQPITVFWQYKAGATPYTIADPDNSLALVYGANTTAVANVTATGFVDQAASQVSFNSAFTDSPLAQTVPANAALNLIITGTTPLLTLGNGTVIITVLYQTITLS